MRNLPIGGARKNNAIAPAIPPQKDAMHASCNASPPRPFLVIGKPSIVVAAEAGVPGVLSRQAEILPPYVEPQ